MGAIVVCGIPGVAAAQTVQTGLTVSGGASAETNPYNEANSSGIVVAATAEVRPRLRYRSESTTIEVAGSAQFRQFVRRYGLEDNYAASANIISRLSESVTLRSRGSYSYNEGGFGGFGRPSLSAGAPLPGVTVPDVTVPGVLLPDVVLIPTDVTILGQRTRVSALDGGAGVDLRLTQRTQVSVDAGVRTMRFGRGPFFNDFNSLNADVRVNQSLNERTSVGVIGSYSKSDFLDTRIGDSDVFSALLSMDTQVGARWTASVAAGVAHATLQQRAGQPDTTFDSLTARLSACTQAEYSRFCLNAQRSPQPSALGDVRVSNSVGADYSYRISPRGQIAVGANYARTGRGRVVVPTLQPAVDFASAFARYDLRLGEAMTFFTSANYSKIFGSNQSRRANAGLAVGVQMGFGALR